MEDLRRQRGPVRRGLTKALIELELELENEFKSKISVQQKYSPTVYQCDQLVSLDRKIDQTLVDFQASEEELAEKYDSVTDFMNRFSDADARVYHYFDTLNFGTESDVRSAQRDVSQTIQYRLPKLEFEKFNGDAKSWLGFWSQFKQIDKDATLAPEDKFQYLIQSTLEGSKAREVVESFPPLSENYPKVIHYFKERFGKEEILLELYVRELLKLVLKIAITPNENSCVSALYDKLETQLRALDTLGVTSDKFAAMLYPLVESCLPEDVLRRWKRNRGHDYDQLEDKKDRLSMLMQFLKTEVDGELRISMARDGFGVDGKKSKPKNKLKPVEEIPTATELFSGHQAPNKIVCIFCEKPGHISKKCNASVRCQVCEKRHYVAMCPDVPKGKIETDKKPTIDEGHPVLASNEELAVRRLGSSAKKLEALGRFDEYQHVFDDWLTYGIIEEVPANELDNTGNYLPHRAVIKESSDTTKVRPVFDASAKKNVEASLNDCLEKGRNLLELIPNIIVGFRFHQIGLISDIEKAFLQISVKKEERDFLRFLWWEKETKEIKKYRHCRVIFGVSSSPFLLATSLKMLFETVP
ncbi:unnamed protein product [Allacma fusca]|uniref:CCHC-type domain-containing protein n=1 Tax=Allacma fusca TaxID=39272 RepID=A0A8J2KY10_9HEXA|nr:unnamed protein product [Allacma fusca]